MPSKVPKNPHSPPRWLDKLLERFCAPHLLEEVMGDLHERYYLKVQRLGEAKARKWYWREVFAYMRPTFLKRRPSSYSKSVPMDMLKNYFIIAFRNLCNKKFYSTINILGLSIGLTCCLFIYLYVQHELSYDTFHNKKDRIYRVVSTFTEANSETSYPTTQIPLAPELEEKHTEVELAVRFVEMDRKLFENTERNVRFYEESFYYAEPAVFDLFSFRLLEGNPSTALVRPNTAVITQSTAEKYFGQENPIGQVLLKGENKEIYQITGLMEDVPANSHLKFDALLSYKTFPEEQFSSWGSWFPTTYLLLKENVSPQEVEQILAGVNKEYVAPIFENFGITIDYWLQPLTDIYLRSNFGDNAGESSDISYIYIFGAVACFILVIASINYMNLTTARATSRAKEVGVRKTMGSLKSQLVKQFLTESIILTFIALIISFILLIILLPFFNQLAGKEISISYLLQPKILTVIVGIALFMGLAGGSYPAFYLSHFKPNSVLKSKATLNSRNILLRRVLVVTQFTVCISMLICTWTVYDQLQYMHNKDLGFKQDQVLSVTMPDSTTQAHYPVFYNQLKTHTNILGVSTSSAKPSDDIFYALMDVDSPDGKVNRGVDFFWAGYDFIETMGINIVEGRNFSQDYITDTTAALVNEAMVARMQWNDPFGQTFTFSDGNEETADPTYTVVGVIQNYHQKSLYSPIEPLAIFFGEPNSFMNIKISPRDVTHTLAFIEDTWAEINMDKPFSYDFLDQEFQSQYQADEKRVQIFTSFSIIAAMIACLGLLGLAAYTIEQRAKEIGIRKIIGASVPSIISLIYKDFIILIIISIFFSFFLAYFFMNDWLQTFAYQTEIKWFNFLASALLTLVITIGTISFNTLRVAFSNPVDSLRNE
ncbi:MAG: ABC transporter permease [Bacteroidota bacterium]